MSNTVCIRRILRRNTVQPAGISTCIAIKYAVQWQSRGAAADNANEDQQCKDRIAVSRPQDENESLQDIEVRFSAFAKDGKKVS